MNKTEIGKILKQATAFSWQYVDHVEEDFIFRVEMWSKVLVKSMTFEFAMDALARHYKNCGWPVTPKDLNERWNERTDDEESRLRTALALEASQGRSEVDQEFMRELRRKFPIKDKVPARVKRFTDAELAEMDRKKNASLMHLQIQNYLNEMPATDA